MDIENVVWLHDDLYEITIHVLGSEQIDLKYLYSLKIIGVDGPKGTVQLYGKNENTYLIDSPTDYRATFQVYGDTQRDECNVWLPNFQIQYEYLQGDAWAYADTWVWGTTSFDLMTGCNNYDNQGNSQTDFPGYYWKIDCNEGCGKTPVQSSSSTDIISSLESSSYVSSYVSVTSSNQVNHGSSSSLTLSLIHI